MKKQLLLFLVLVIFASGDVIAEKDYPSVEEAQSFSKEDWLKRLSKHEYKIMFKQGTERPFTGDLLKNTKKGTYVSAACGQPVFHSDQKYDSKTGWPSFWAPIDEDNIKIMPDYSLFGTKRYEVIASQCGEHLGHVFEDGPAPTGLRYCINSAALDFVEDAN